MIRVFIQEGSSENVFGTIKTEWQELFAATGVSPFLTWEWMSVWFENFGENKKPVILKAYRDEKLVGILPMFLKKKRVLGMAMNRLSLMGEGIGGADHLDIIARPEDSSEAMSAIFDFLQAERYCDLMRLENLPDESATVGLLERLVQTSRVRLSRISKSVTAVCPQIDLTIGWEAVLNEGKRSNNFKRRLKKLEKTDGFEYRSIISTDETGVAFERFLRLHEKRWEKVGGSELSGHPRLIAFQRRLVEQLSLAGLIRFDELWVDGECRSSAYGLDDGKTFYYYNSGYDLEYSHLSVGLVLLGLSIKHAIERGNSLYDFLRGDETYKFDWANRSTNLNTVSIHSNSLSAFAHEWIEQGSVGVRAFSKSIVPSGTAETLKNWRRAWKRNYQMR